MTASAASLRVLVTGAAGFIGKNAVLRLRENGFEVLENTRSSSPAALRDQVRNADAVLHLAGVNRPEDPLEFERVNAGGTAALLDAVASTHRPVPVLLTSSTQAELDNPYGRSKLAAEEAVATYAGRVGATALIYRLPGVFGKWCRPNYNSVVATFCHNIANGLPIRVDDPARVVRLVYVDDVVSDFIDALRAPAPRVTRRTVEPEYSITLGELAARVEAFRDCRTTLVSERVGAGLTRALYATYVSYLPKESFSYELPAHADPRGVFVEFLKTPDAGQFSFFTAHPGVTRGGHYHHTKTEKFLVVKGKARFRFRHMLSGELHELDTDSSRPVVVDTVPGWTHDITNIGDGEMIVMLWANENFDRARPDTIACKV